MEKCSRIEEISIKEKNILNDVMSYYDYRVINFYKCRSAYKVETDCGFLCLKRMRRGAQKVANGYYLVQQLHNINFTNVANYILTKNGDYYVKKKQYIFYLTQWLSGEECTINSIEEVVRCTELLAQFHTAVKKIDISPLKIDSNLKNWPHIFSSNLADLEKFKYIIEKKIIKHDFDKAFLSYIDSFYQRGLTALNFLNRSKYYSISRSARNKHTICHDSFYYQNILKDGDKYYIIDLDSIIIDLQVNDLGKFIRRLMYRKEFSWDFEVARQIIEAYRKINEVSYHELEIMLALIVFPHKFWKLGKKRYFKNKHWSEQKYIHKLDKIIMFNEAQDLFLRDYMLYIQNFDSQ